MHLFVFGQRVQQIPDWARVFSTINFYHEPTMSPWQGEQYLGTNSDAWSIPTEQKSGKGLLGWLDVAINFHNATANNIMGHLRRAGVITAMSLHVHDLTHWNRPAGYGYLTLGYEHAYNLIVPCSDGMADWCHSMGVPEEKIMVVHNAGGYPLGDRQIAKILSRKKIRQSQQSDRLRVLFLGRFDRQKGLDRLVNIVEKCRQQSLPIDWKLVGKSVLADRDTAQKTACLSDLIEPPALTTDELNQLYEWADVLLLPSYWEGLPLTILEAMRLGVVMCASDVGAVTEVIEHEVTGLIIPNHLDGTFTNATVSTLSSLIDNSSRLQEIATAASEYAIQNSWQKASSSLINKLESLVI